MYSKCLIFMTEDPLYIDALEPPSLYLVTNILKIPFVLVDHTDSGCRALPLTRGAILR